MWISLFVAGEFIRKIGITLAESLEYFYPTKDDANITEYIQKN